MALDGSLSRLNPIVSLLVSKGDLLNTLLFVDRPMERHRDW